MTQTRLGSLIEAVANTVIGFAVTLIGQLAIFPAFGVRTSFGTTLGIVACFTLLSVLRGYVLRRWFNGRLHAAAQRLAARAAA